MVSFLAKVKIFRFWPKTMDYNKAFLPKSRSFSAVLLLHSGRCYGTEICIILFLLRCPFIWYPFWPKSKFSDFGQKPCTLHYNALKSNSSRFRVLLYTMYKGMSVIIALFFSFAPVISLLFTGVAMIGYDRYSCRFL